MRSTPDPATRRAAGPQNKAIRNTADRPRGPRAPARMRRAAVRTILIARRPLCIRTFRGHAEKAVDLIPSGCTTPPASPKDSTATATLGSTRRSLASSPRSLLWPSGPAGRSAGCRVARCLGGNVISLCRGSLALEVAPRAVGLHLSLGETSRSPADAGVELQLVDPADQAEAGCAGSMARSLRAWRPPAAETHLPKRAASRPHGASALLEVALERVAARRRPPGRAA